MNSSPAPESRSEGERPCAPSKSEPASRELHNQSLASAQEMLPAPLVQQIHAAHAARFVADGVDFLRTILHFVEYPGAWHGCYMIGTQRQSPFLEKGMALHEELKRLIPAGLGLIDDLSGLLQQRDPAAISDLVVQRLHPYFGELSSLMKSAFALKVEVAEKWFEKGELQPIEHVKESEYRHLSRHNLELGARFMQMARRAAPVDGPIALNLAVLRGLLHMKHSDWIRHDGLSKKFDFCAPRGAVRANRADVVFVVHGAAQKLRDAVTEINDALAREIPRPVMEKLRAGALADDSPEIAALQHLHFGSHDPEVRSRKPGEIELIYEFPEFLEKRWLLMMPKLIDSLSLESQVVAAYNGRLKAVLRTGSPAVRLLIKFPVVEEEPVKDYTPHPYVVNGLRKPECLDDSLERRDVSLQCADPRSYELRLPGAAILPTQKPSKVPDAVLKLESLLQALPQINEVCLSVPVGRLDEDTMGRFENGDISLRMMKCSKIEPLGRKDLLKQLNEPFEWEMSSREWDLVIERYMKNRDRVDSKFSACCMSLGPGLICEPDVVAPLEEICRKAQVLQLDLDHPDWHDPGRLPKYHELVKSFLPQLIRMLDEVRSTCGCEKPKLSVGCFVCIRVADHGKSSSMYFAEVYDQKNHERARGEFDMKTGKLKYKIHNAFLLGKTLQRMGGFFGALVSREKRAFRALDKILAEAQVELPEEVLSELIDQAQRGASKEEMEKAVAGFLRKPRTEIAESEGVLKVSYEHQPEPEGPAYGVITQLNGDHPEEIVDYEKAKELYESGDITFHPSARFLGEYGQGGGT